MMARADRSSPCSRTRVRRRGRGGLDVDVHEGQSDAIRCVSCPFLSVIGHTGVLGSSNDSPRCRKLSFSGKGWGVERRKSTVCHSTDIVNVKL